MEIWDEPQKNTDEHLENVKAKLESAKEELKKRYGEVSEKIREEVAQEEEHTKDMWDGFKTRF